MAGRIPDEAVQDVRDRASIVEVISSYVALRRAGRNHLGLCPFHGEKTPSFTVSEERGLFHCFGCGAGGTVFTFLMRMENIDFVEAVELLARRVGVELPTRESDGPAAREREQLIEINKWAAKRFTQALNGREGEAARRYLLERGVNPTLAERFGLGWAPPAGDVLSRSLVGHNDAARAAERAGLIGRREGGGLYDKFRSRVMFPITDGRGRLVGFGGRIVGDGQPKYLNSPETPVFRKGEVLYGLAQARAAIRSCDQVVIVEGYLDALALVEHGIEQVVATLGTALTPGHLRLVGRLAAKVVVCFDGDRAGRGAAMRAFGVCAEAGIWAAGTFLPEGEDPDTFVRKHGAAAMQAALDGALPLSEFYLAQMRPPPGAGVAERSRAAGEVARVLGSVRSIIERDLLLRQAAERLGVGEEALRGAAKGQPPRVRAASSPIPTSQAPASAAELQLLEAVAADVLVAEEIEERGTVEHFRDAETAAWVRRLLEAWRVGADAVAGVIDEMPDGLAGRMSAAAVASISPDERMQAARDCARRIEETLARRAVESALVELREATAQGDEDRERELLRHVEESARQRQRSSA